MGNCLTEPGVISTYHITHISVETLWILVQTKIKREKPEQLPRLLTSLNLNRFQLRHPHNQSLHPFH